MPRPRRLVLSWSGGRGSWRDVTYGSRRWAWRAAEAVAAASAAAAAVAEAEAGAAAWRRSRTAESAAAAALAAAAAAGSTRRRRSSGCSTRLLIPGCRPGRAGRPSLTGCSCTN